MEVIKLEQKANGELFTSSLEIARVTEKKHKSVLRDIREEIGTNVSQSKYTDKANRKQNYYILDEYQTLQVMSRYSRDVRTMVISEFKRMKEYIKSQQQPKNYDEMSLNNKAIALIGEIQERNLFLEQQNKQLSDRNKEVSDTLLAFQKDGTALCVRDFVKYIYSENNIKITQKEVWELIDSKYVYKKKVGSKYQRMPKAQYQQYFEFKNITINEKVHRDFMISRKGVLYFANKITKMQKENETLVI